VVNDVAQVVAVVSQSTVLRFLAENSNRIEHEKLEKSIDQVEMITKNPVTVSCEADVVHAVHLMKEAGVPAVAVVNPVNSALVATFSVSDVTGLSQEYFGDLTKNVMSFLTTHSTPKLPPFTCRSSSVVEFVLMKLVALKLHRLWLMDERERPNGVVSLTDVIRYFYEQYKKQ